MEVLIGAGGWAYFEVPGMSSLEAYSRAFNFVEVNSTFYTFPPRRMVESWLSRVPPGFEFSVRCHRDVTHKHMLEPKEDAQEALSKTIETCRTLGAKTLVFTTPPRLEMSQEKLEAARNLLEGAELRGIGLAWEVRAYRSRALPPGLVSLMADLGISHCVDLSFERPALQSEFLYSRLFGKGQHNVYQFDDQELREIDQSSRGRPEPKGRFVFHTVRMYTDAARLKVHRSTGKFPMATGSTGLSSVREVLEKDASFPTTRGRLIEKHGWKLVDLSEDRRARVSSLLELLPEQGFESLDYLLSELDSSGAAAKLHGQGD